MTPHAQHTMVRKAQNKLCVHFCAKGEKCKIQINLKLAILNSNKQMLEVF